MNSPETSASPQATAPAQRRFDWIELLAIPIAIAIMEAQPTILILSFISLPFTGTLRPWPLETYTVTLLLVGLHWWALYARTFEERGASSQQVQLLRLLGLGIAYGAVLLTHIGFLSNIFQLLLTLALVTWFWKRGLDKAQPNLADGQLLTPFRVGFIALLVLLLITFLNINLDNMNQDSPSLYLRLLPVFGNSLPIFFLSGLLALSFTRLATIRRENARSSLVSTVDPTRNWLIVLTLLWGVVVALTLALETFSFNTLANIFTPVWNLLGLLVSLLLYLILLVLGPLASLLNAFFIGQGNRHLSLPPQPPSQAPPPIAYSTLPTEALLIGRIILLVLLLVLLILAIRLILKRWHARYQDENEEEIREGLPIRSTLQARRQEQQRQQQEPVLALEALDPHSARARYRELLQALAWNNASLARHPDETPTEYQARLITQIKASPRTEQVMVDTDPALLEELTQAYIQERYGGKQLKQQQVAYSSSWIAQLVKRLTGR